MPFKLQKENTFMDMFTENRPGPAISPNRRIMFVASKPFLGGGEYRLIEDAQYALSTGSWDRVAAAYKFGGDLHGLAQNIEGLERYDVPIEKPRPSLPSLWGLLKAIRSFQPDVVVGINSVASVYCRLVRAISGRSFVNVFSNHGWHFQHAESTSTHSLASAVRAGILTAVEKLTAPFLDAATFVSGSDLRTARDMGFHEQAELRLIRNGIEASRLDAARAPLPERFARYFEDGPVITCIARLTPEKGHKTLISALSMLKADLPDAALLVIGKGDLREELEQWTETCDLRKGRDVVFTGFLSRELVDQLHWRSSVSVLPSFVEPWGRVNAEAMLFRTPVVTTDVPGARELVRDGKDGQLVPPGEPETLARAIRTAIERPPMIDRMVETAQARVMDKFTLRRNVQERAEYFERLWSSRFPARERTVSVPAGQV